MSDTINRRKFILSSASVMGTAALAPLYTYANVKDAAATDSNILKTGPYLQAVLPDQVTVRWITGLPCYSWVAYGTSPDHLDKKAETIDDGLTAAFNTINAIVLNDLIPGTTYHYRIYSKSIQKFEPYEIVYGETYESGINVFKTPAIHADKVSFLVFNDIHDRPESFPVLMQYANPSDHDFVFLNGDMFDYHRDEDQLADHLITPLTKLFASNIPFIYARGNHETRGKFARNLPEYFDGYGHKFYYSFQYGPMYAIVLDSGEDKADDTPVYAGITNFDDYRLKQAEWLKKEVRKEAFKKAKHKVVFSHIPLHHAGDWHGTNHCRQVWGEILNDAKIDLLISGHTHVHGIFPPEKAHNYHVVIGGGPQNGNRTITKVYADKKGLQLEMLDDSGSRVGTVKINVTVK